MDMTVKTSTKMNFIWKNNLGFHLIFILCEQQLSLSEGFSIRFCNKIIFNLNTEKFNIFCLTWGKTEKIESNAFYLKWSPCAKIHQILSNFKAKLSHMIVFSHSMIIAELCAPKARNFDFGYDVTICPYMYSPTPQYKPQWNATLEMQANCNFHKKNKMKIEGTNSTWGKKANQDYVHVKKPSRKCKNQVCLTILWKSCDLCQKYICKQQKLARSFKR